MAKKRKKRPALINPERDGVPVDAVGAPAEGTAAGDVGDVGRDRRAHEVKRARTTAKQHFKAARQLIDRAPADAEREARAAIGSVVHAFWWAEDTALEDAQHELMHKIGRWTRRQCGCPIDFDGERYVRTCPIDIAHRRIGLSIGYTATLLCSICGDDVSECPHLRSTAYWVRGGVGPSGYCPVCMGQDCGHSYDRLYRVTVSQIVTDMQPREVSFVSRPAGVTTRFVELPLPTEDLQAKFGSEFEVGMPVSCDLCLGDCWGFTELPDDA